VFFKKLKYYERKFLVAIMSNMEVITTKERIQQLLIRYVEPRVIDSINILERLGLIELPVEDIGHVHLCFDRHSVYNYFSWKKFLKILKKFNDGDEHAYLLYHLYENQPPTRPNYDKRNILFRITCYTTYPPKILYLSPYDIFTRRDTYFDPRLTLAVRANITEGDSYCLKGRKYSIKWCIE